MNRDTWSVVLSFFDKTSVRDDTSRLRYVSKSWYNHFGPVPPFQRILHCTGDLPTRGRDGDIAMSGIWSVFIFYRCAWCQYYMHYDRIMLKLSVYYPIEHWEPFHMDEDPKYAALDLYCNEES